MSIAYRLEELLVGKENRYCLAVIASKRARELNAGAPVLVKSETRKITSLALEEVLQGKIKYQRRTESPPKEEENKPLSLEEKGTENKKSEVQK